MPKVTILILFFYLQLSTAESGQYDCKQYDNNSRQIDILSEINIELRQELVRAYVEKFNKNFQGDEVSCSSLSGIFDFTNNSEVMKAKIEPVRFSDIESLTPLFDQSFNGVPKAIYEVNQLGSRGAKTKRALIVEDDSGWKIIYNKGGIKKFKPSISGLSELAPADFNQQALKALALKRKGVNTDGVKIEELEFDKGMLKGASGNFSLEYKPVETINNFVKENPPSPKNLSDYIDNHSLRIPPQMYDILNDPKFIEARKNKKYSEQFDIIHEKARSLFPGQEITATLVSMITTDLRSRGPCGAIYGKRGKITPRGIFDGEETSMINGNRYDAAQHFFGYNLATTILGEKLTGTLSWQRKKRQKMGPKIRNLFTSLHLGATPLEEGGADEFDFEHYSKTPRREVDIQRDNFFDQMGRDFNRAVKKDVTSKPSETINSSVYFSKRKKLGLCRPGSRNWKAYDPELEPYIVTTKPRDERTVCRNYDGEKNGKLRSLRCNCQNSNNSELRSYDCLEFHNLIKAYQVNLKREGKRACGY